MNKSIRKCLWLLVLVLLFCPGCIIMSDIAESFSCVPYGGMYTRSYWTEPFEKDGVQYLDRYEAQFPIGFWGNLNVKFWNAFGDYRKTSTFERYKKWHELPDKERGKVVGRYKKVGKEWVEIPLD